MFHNHKCKNQLISQKVMRGQPVFVAHLMRKRVGRGGSARLQANVRPIGASGASHQPQEKMCLFRPKSMCSGYDVIARVTCAPLQVNNITEMLNGSRWLITVAPFKKPHQVLHMKHNPPSGV